MTYYGDITLEDTVHFKFTTVDGTGVPTTLAGSPVVSVYEDNSATQITTAETLTVDFDSVTGLNHLLIAATASNGFEAGKDYQAVITTGTVDSVSVVGYVVGSFSVQARHDYPTAAIVANKLDHLVAVADSDDPVNNSIVAKLAASDGDWSGFSAASDALEALRDRGDTAWTTGAGGSAPTVEEIRAEMDSNSTQFAAIVEDTGTTLPATLATIASYIDTEVAAILADTGTTLDGKIDAISALATGIKAVTDLLPDAGALSSLATQSTADAIETDTQDIQSRIPAALVAGRMSSDMVALSGSTAAADQLEESAKMVLIRTVDTVTNGHTPTTSEFQADDETEATADHYIGRTVIFTSGALLGQASDITDYAAVGGIGQFTVTAMTDAPSNDDSFIVI